MTAMPTPLAKDAAPAIASYPDHEVITPPNKLRKAIKPASKGDDDPVTRAEKALADLSSEFSDWMRQESDRLDAARRQIRETGFNKTSHQALFHAAHDIKGEAATFGYPACAAAAESLCRLIEHTPSIDRIPIPLMEQHVDAIRAIIREYSRSDAQAMAVSLTKALRTVTDEFLVKENQDRPDHLEAILGPTLLSGGSA
jgi:HPt (histidine-containing phosphotransfer) domain-containing protein